MDAMDSGYDSDDDHMYTEMLENISDRSQSHQSVNIGKACYKVRDCIHQRQSEWKGALDYTQNMGKGLHKVFKNVLKYIYQDLL